MGKPLLQHLIRRLRLLREKHGLTQEQFAERTGISYKYYQAVEAGRKAELRLSTLERLANAYSIEVWELLGPDLPATKVSSRSAPTRSTKTRRRASR